MPISRRQLDRVLNVSGHAFIDPAGVPEVSRRFTESYTRRRLFALEDQTVIEQFRLYKQAFRDIRSWALDIGDGLEVNTLGEDRRSVEWRRTLLRSAEPRLRRLAQEVALEAYNASVTAYLAGYYGRVWAVDMQTTDAYSAQFRTLDTATVSQIVLDRPLLEAEGDRLLYDLLGGEWRARYADELDDLILRMRRSLNRSIAEGHGIRDAMRVLADTMGVDIDRRKAGRRVIIGPRGGRTVVYNRPEFRANFNRVQTLTRSFVLRASNDAAMAAYEDNADVVGGVQFSPANDGRVCPICEGFRDKVWPLGSDVIVRPVSDTHPNCRCSLIPVVMEPERFGDDITIRVADDAPPRLTFAEWIGVVGLGFLLQDEFFGGRTLDSTQV